VFIYKSSTDTDLSDHCQYAFSELKLLAWPVACISRNEVKTTDILIFCIVNVAWVSVTLWCESLLYMMVANHAKSAVVFWVGPPCHLVGGYQCFEETYNLHLYFTLKMEAVQSSKRW